jgi:hypothetical protein
MFKVITDCSTGETVHIPLTEAEIAEHNAAVARSIAEQEQRERDEQELLAREEEARESARAKLAALGLTEAEVAALVK